MNRSIVMVVPATIIATVIFSGESFAQTLSAAAMNKRWDLAYKAGYKKGDDEVTKACRSQYPKGTVRRSVTNVTARFDSPIDRNVAKAILAEAYDQGYEYGTSGICNPP
jgi:hypothetical protein